MNSVISEGFRKFLGFAFGQRCNVQLGNVIQWLSSVFFCNRYLFFVFCFLFFVFCFLFLFFVLFDLVHLLSSFSFKVVSNEARARRLPFKYRVVATSSKSSLSILGNIH
jgi:hypothetical protein